jgi:hypothetical protein
MSNQAGINSSANNMNTTFFMADRMKKNPIKFQQYRPSSIDETMNNIMIKSTNDSGI